MYSAAWCSSKSYIWSLLNCSFQHYGFIWLAEYWYPWWNKVISTEIWTSQVVLVVKNSSANTRDVGSIPGLGRSPGGGHGNPLQYSSLENPKERGTWWPTVHRVAKSWVPLQHLSSTEIHQLYKMHFLTFKPFLECLFVCFSQLLFICLWPESAL